MSDAVSIQDALGSAGECPRFEWRGKTYKVGFPDDRAKARLEELVAQAETAAVVSLKGAIPDDDYRTQLADLGRQLRAGVREQRTKAGKLWREYMFGRNREQGFVLYLLALVQGEHPEVTETTLTAMLEESGDLLLLAADRVVPGFFDFLAAQMGVPPEVLAPVKERMTAALHDLLAGRTPSGSTG